MAAESAQVGLPLESTLARLRDANLYDAVRAFAAGREVPGSGSANALAAAVAACLTVSVAIKTYKHDGTKYVHVRDTAIDVERRATRIAEQLLDLVEEDSAAFAPVIAIRRNTGRLSDPILQDRSLRTEVAALKPATEIPLRIGRLAIDVAHLATTMLDSGFTPARGESYTALSQAIAALDGAIFVAQLNVKTVRGRIAKLNDPELEAEWVTRMVRNCAELRAAWHGLRVREHIARKASDREMFGEPATEPAEAG